MGVRAEMGIMEIQETMGSGEITAKSLVEYHVERIEAFDRQAHI